MILVTIPGTQHTLCVLSGEDVAELVADMESAIEEKEARPGLGPDIDPSLDFDGLLAEARSGGLQYARLTNAQMAELEADRPGAEYFGLAVA